MAVNYQKKAETLETVSKLYSALKQKVQTGQGHSVTMANAEHTLPSLGPIPRPDTYSHYPVPKPTMPEISAIRRGSHQTKWQNELNGVEILHPFQRSGSARGPTSSEIAATAHHLVPPPVATGTKGKTSRLGATATPAQRVSLNQVAGQHTFPHTSHQLHRSQQFNHYPVDRFALGQDQFYSRSHHPHVSGVISPEGHARMPA